MADRIFQGAIIIHEVYAEGAAARDGRLLAGDQILEVSGNDLRNATHDEAIQVISHTSLSLCITGHIASHLHIC